MSRPAIPTAIKRKILIESVYRCAIPTCRYPVTENAHIVSWSDTSNHNYENLITLCPNCHTLYDTGKIPKEAIIAYKKKLMFLNEVYSPFELDVLDYLKKNKQVLLPCEIIVKRLLEEVLIKIHEIHMSQPYDDGTEMLGYFTAILTEKGQALIEAWSKVDISLTHEVL